MGHDTYLEDGRASMMYVGRESGTLWAAYNGVAELVDHEPTKRSASDRLGHIWFGSGSCVKVRAYDAAQKQMVGEWHR
jgi:hypothetical protein